MTRSVRLTFLFGFMLGLCGGVQGASLRVSPGRFIVHDIEPGKEYDIHKETGFRITIYNDDDVSRTWVLSTYRPSERGRWERGYAEIPDPQWCWFKEKLITVEPQSREYGYLHLKIPDEEKYHNQHWVVTLGIEGKPMVGGIGLAANIRAQIETKSKVNMQTRPDGLLGFAPSTVRLEDVVPGSREKSDVVVYNNDDIAHSYAISSLFEDSKTKRKSYLTRTYIEMPETGWIKRKKEIRIEPGGRATLSLELAIPGDPSSFGKKWEDILLIQPDEGLAGFVRVQVETRKAEE